MMLIETTQAFLQKQENGWLTTPSKRFDHQYNEYC